jgi:hypothetical protein
MPAATSAFFHRLGIRASLMRYPKKKRAASIDAAL